MYFVKAGIVLFGFYKSRIVSSKHHCYRFPERRAELVSFLTLRSLALYIYGAPILDVSRSHRTTQHSR